MKKNWKYIAILLDESSRMFLEDRFRKCCPNHWKKYGDHITLAFNNRDEASAAFGQKLQDLAGKEAVASVTSIGSAYGVIAAGVSLENGIPCCNRHPHVTLACMEGVAPKESNNIADDQWFSLTGNNVGSIKGTITIL